MTLDQFETMEEQRQLEVVWRHGILLSRVEEGDFEYELHQVNSFYIEFKNVIRYPGYNNMRMFLTTDLLERYTRSIDISGLLQE